MHIENNDECTMLTLMPTFLLYARQEVVAVGEPVDGEDEEGVGKEREGNREGGVWGGESTWLVRNSRKVK